MRSARAAAATGGRGGDVYHVTTLADYNNFADEPKIPGSFRHALRSAEGPRTIVFDVAGVIQLKARLEVLKSDLTIAGQTSPGGITLCGYPFEISQAADVIVRHLRVRLGDFRVRLPASDEGFAKLDPGSSNAVDVGSGSQRIILDHVSAAWGMDETLSVTNCRDITIQQCIIAESLNDSYHPKGPHGYGTLVRGMLTAADQEAHVGGYTFFENLWAHHRARNPSVGGQQRIPAGEAEDARRRTDVNLVNNVIFDWGDMPTHRSQSGQVRINLIGNYYVCGPAKSAETIFRESETAPTQLYHEGNRRDADQDPQHNGVLIDATAVAAFRDFDDRDTLLHDANSQPFPFLGAVAQKIVSADEAYQQVIESAGASLWRDATDQRIMASLRDRRGKIIDSQEELRDTRGKLAGIDDAPVRRRAADFDSDQDGMPDTYEREQGLNPQDASDGAELAANQSGYTNLEIYLDRLTRSG